MLTVNELFSGIGAQRKALERLGVPHRVVGISEIDRFAIRSYEAIFGETRNYGDISAVDKLDYADFWTYSFPCTDISVAGKQAGINEHTRSGLLYQVERLLNISKELGELPKYLMLENVKNLVGKRFKGQFDKWLEYLDELGFNNYWQVLNAKNYGIPQNRERVFVISIRKDVDDGNFKFPQPFDNGLRLKHLLEDSVDEKFYLRQDLQDNFRKHLESKQSLDAEYIETTGVNVSNLGTKIDGTTDTSLALLARNYKGLNNYGMTAVVELQQAGTLKGCGLPYDKMHDQSGRVYHPEGIAPTLHTCGGGNLEPKIIQRARGFNKGGVYENCPTITSNSFQESNLVAEPAVLRSERTEYGK